MTNFTYRDTAIHYCVDDLSSASRIGTRLQNILEALRSGKPATQLSLDFLQRQGLEALRRLAVCELPYDRFRELALTEQGIRCALAQAARAARETLEAADQAARDARAEALQIKMRLAREQEQAARLARERDPKYITKTKNKTLRARYGIDIFIEQHCFDRLMNILNRVDGSQRLTEEDFVWLSSVGERYFSERLRAAYHRLEAEFFANEFNAARNPWMAVNASGHYRKCDRAREADALLCKINIENQKSARLKSALCTTRGGVMRDLQRWYEGFCLGGQAHAYQPDDYRPCTLLGALYMETGHYTLGQDWYAKAVDRGATVDSVDQDLRNIFFRADPAKQAEMKAFLLGENPIRYAWVSRGRR